MRLFKLVGTLLSAAVLAIAPAAVLAQSSRTSGRSTEVLVLVTATKVTGALFTESGTTGKSATQIYNAGPNALHCKVGSSSGLSTTVGHLVPVSGYWAVPGGADIYCITSANQLTGAATIVSEVLGGSGSFESSFAPTVGSSGAVAENLTQIAGNSVSAGNGASGTGTQRVTIASDSTGQLALAAGSATIGALTANQTVDVAKMNGVATSMGNGASGTGTQRVTIASDSTGQLALAAGSATIGALTANQTVNVAKIAGANTATGNGGTDSGTQRVTLASDSTGFVNANISQIGGSTISTSSNMPVGGPAAAGAAVSGNPVLIAGNSGGTVTRLSLDSSGHPVVVGPAADGAAVSDNPVRIAGKDGSGNTQDLLSDTSGLLRMEGSAAAGAAAGGKWSTPITVACGTGTTSSATLTAGQVYEMTSDIDIFIRPAASATTSWRPLWAKTYLYARQVETGGSAGVIACITASGSGTLYLTPITTAE